VTRRGSRHEDECRAFLAILRELRERIPTELEHRETPDQRWWVEIIGFWTSDYLQHKLATYRAARLPRVILCIDAKRSIDERQLPVDARIVRFTKSIPLDQILGIIDAEASSGATRAMGRQGEEVASVAAAS
jgi:hypothetical protein